MENTWTALSELGYSPKESEFLSFAVAHSGYFLRRQYDAYHPTGSRRAATLFLFKLLAKQHAEALPCRGRQWVFHLDARPIYAALGREPVRFREERHGVYIKTRLLALDFALRNQAFRYLTTEQERVAYFAELGIDPSFLPASGPTAGNGTSESVPYFMDGFPLFLSLDRAGDSRISFTFIDPGLSGVKRFVSFLNHYHPLFSKLDAFTVVYLSDAPNNFAAAERAFHAYRFERLEDTAPDTHPLYQEVLRYFELESQLDDQRLEPFTASVVREYHDKATRFADKEFKTLYQKYRAGGTIFPHELTRPKQKAATRRAEFETYCVANRWPLVRPNGENSL